MKKYFLSLNLLLLIFCSSIFALTEGNVSITQNVGDTIRTGVIFNSYPLTSTSYVYNEVGGTSTTDGWITVEGFEKILVLVQPTTIYSGTITARIEGKAFSGSLVGNLVTLDYGTNTTIATSIPIMESLYQIRVGYGVTSPTGSGTVNAVIRLEKTRR